MTESVSAFQNDDLPWRVDQELLGHNFRGARGVYHDTPDLDTLQKFLPHRTVPSHSNPEQGMRE